MGMVLLIGMVAAGSIGIFLVAGEMMSSAEQQSEQERIEQAFIELSNSISSSASSGDVSQSMDLHAGDRGAIAHHDSATYRIWTESYNDTNESGDDVASGSIGTIEYENEDGLRIAYEGGAVFRETGERTQVLSAPPLDYDHGSNTLTFPVFGLAEEKTIDSGEISVRQTSVDRESVNYIQDDHVFVEIESDYCRGWEQYFVDEAGDTTLQEECYGGENEDGKVKVRLGYDDVANAFSAGVALPSEDNIETNGNGNKKKSPIDAEKIDEAEFTPLDDTIEQLVDDFEENASRELQTSDSNPSGTYYTEHLNESYDFNLSDGDAIVAVNDGVTVDGNDITVSDCGDGKHSLKIYAQGDFVLYDDVKPTCENGDVDTIQLYGTSMTSVDFHDSSSIFRGMLYVASDQFDPDNGEYQIDFSGAGNVKFEGAIIANSIKFGSSANGIDVDGIDNSDLEVIPNGYEPAPQLTYLNVAEHTIEIENN